MSTISPPSSRALDPAVPVMALGLGSNLIVRDGGVPGVVVRLRQGVRARSSGSTATDAALRRRGDRASSSRRTARDAGIAGLEFLRSIPGTVGGFVRMNGGAYGREVERHPGRVRRRAARGRAADAGASASSATPIAIRDLPEGAIVVAATFRGHARRARGDPGRDGPHRRRARGVAAAALARPAARPSRIPTGHKAWAAGRRGRLPRPAARRCAGQREALQFPAQPRRRDQRRDRGAGRGGARRGEGAIAASTLEWEIQRVGVERQ